MKMFARRSGFTLAETLFTTVIIGIVMSRTMPVVINDYKNKIIVARVKKVYAMLTQTYNTATQERGTPIRWHLTDSSVTATSILGNQHWYKIQFEKNLKIMKNCENEAKGCALNKKVTLLSGMMSFGPTIETDKSYYKFEIADDIAIYLKSLSQACNFERGGGALAKTCGEIYVDIDGPDKGNSIYGEDIFVFYLTKTGVFPYKAEVEDKAEIEKSCLERGEACSAWVLRYGNAKYLLKRR